MDDPWNMHASARRSDSHQTSTHHTDKRALRREFLAMRARYTADDVRVSARLLAQHALELPELAHATTVTAYVPVGTEPGTGDLLDALRARGTRVLLPVLRADDDLDWGVYEGPGSLAPMHRPGRLTLLEPAAPHLEPDAVLTAGAVLLPGLAVDREGTRLGRGGGSYDRVLERLARAFPADDATAAPADASADASAGTSADAPAGVPTGRAGPVLVVLLYDDEVVAQRLPREPHDRPVHAAVTPSGVHRF